MVHTVRFPGSTGSGVDGGCSLSCPGTRSGVEQLGGFFVSVLAGVDLPVAVAVHADLIRRAKPRRRLGDGKGVGRRSGGGIGRDNGGKPP